MDVFSAVLKNRELNSQDAQRAAEEIFRNQLVSEKHRDRIEDVEKTVGYVLKKFKKKERKIVGCNNVEEVLEAMLPPEGVMYDKIDLTEFDWKSHANYIVAFKKTGTPVLLHPSGFGYCARDVVSGKKSRIGKISEYQNEAYLIFRPMEGKEFSVVNFALEMTHYVTFRDVFRIIMVTVAVSLVGMVIPYVNRMILKCVQETGMFSKHIFLIQSLLVAYVAASLMRLLCSMLKEIFLNQTKASLSSQMQMVILGKILLLDYEFFVTESIGKLSAQLTNAKKLTGYITDFVLNNLFGTIMSLIYVYQIYNIAGVLLLPSLAVLILQMATSIFLGIISAKNTADRIENTSELQSITYEMIKGYQKISESGAQNRVLLNIAKKYTDYYKSQYKAPIWVRINDELISAISSGGSLVILVLAIVWGVERADYIAFLASFGLLSGAVNGLVGMAKAVIQIRPLSKSLKSILDGEMEEREGLEYVQDLKGGIVLQNVSFGYGTEIDSCLKDISLEIKSGEKIALVGESGCGKSTLLTLLLGMRRPTKGMILYDDSPLSVLNKRSLRKKIGSVFQFSSVFPGSIRMNVAFNSVDLTDEEVMDALRKAYLEEDVKKLPLGLDTEISEGSGGAFSGGQRQRLMIARAIAQKPRILILDEATSALDNIAQKNVLKSIYDLDITVIMVAHRLSTVRKCDRIIMLENGQIVEEGNYEELINKNGSFAHLVKKQIIQEE